VPSVAIRTNTGYPFAVYGTGLYSWYYGAGGNFSYSIQDPTHPSVTWGNYTFVAVVQNAWNGYDGLTFNASETGSSTGSSTINITVTLTNNGFSLCPGRWNQQPITYA
jgi:hypothetical protein